MLGKLEASFSARIEELDADIHQVGSRVLQLEEDRDVMEDRMTRLESGLEAHNTYIQRLHRALDDQDNRGRRNNLRLRGLPESPEGGEHLMEILRIIFNKIMGKPPDAPVHFDRAHRALKPKGTQNTMPRDVICRLHYHRQKEEILQAARRRELKDSHGNTLQLYPDLSWTTLQARRLLKPVTEALRERQIRYRWGYPFALLVSVEGVHYTIGCAADLPPLLKALAMEDIAILDWYGGASLDMAPPPTQPQRPRWQTPSKRGRGVPRAQISTPTTQPPN
uniref:Transposase n=1 Tax=Leptobrachium leishanense TaxID=445787 RepID=A0A8C5QR76_9ANUR